MEILSRISSNSALQTYQFSSLLNTQAVRARKYLKYVYSIMSSSIWWQRFTFLSENNQILVSNWAPKSSLHICQHR